MLSLCKILAVFLRKRFKRWLVTLAVYDTASDKKRPPDTAKDFAVREEIHDMRHSTEFKNLFKCVRMDSLTSSNVSVSTGTDVIPTARLSSPPPPVDLVVPQAQGKLIA